MNQSQATAIDHAAATRFVPELRGALAEVVVGQERLLDMLLIGLLTGGHVLLEGVPGLAKTLAVSSLAKAVRGSFSRIQFTPDLLPSDLVGTEIYSAKDATFTVRRGPVFANFVLADEINRAPSKVQSALLEAMAERQVTVDGSTYPLAAPFLVIATQNPIEHEGTFPLPDSQLDRFLVRIEVGYPDVDAELAMLESHGSVDPLLSVSPVLHTEDVLEMRRAAAAVHVAPALKQYLVQLADRTRAHPQLELGMSPRATLSFLRIARVWAAMRDRDYATPDDVKALAVPVLAHRLLVTPEADLQGVTASDVVRDVLDSVPVPRPRSD